MSEVRDLLDALRHTLDIHAKTSAPLTAEQLRTMSYDNEWNVGQLLSHMGSQAEIMDLFINASAKGEPAPGREVFTPVWDRWNAMSPEEQRDNSITATQAHQSLLDSLTDEQLDGIDIPFFGETNGADFIRIRLGEYAVHTWDLTVTFDPQSTINAESVPAVLARMPQVLGRYKNKGEPFTLAVQTSDPDESCVLDFDKKISLREGTDSTPNRLTLTAEAFVRLTFGRLDAGHTPADTKIEGDITLDQLRSIFTGF